MPALLAGKIVPTKPTMSGQLNSSISLYQLLTEVDDAIKINMPSTYWVRAEILQVRHRGYWALELSSYEDGKKAKATAMIWQSQGDIVNKFEKAAGIKLATGLKVMIRVDVGFHSEYGLRLTVLEFDSNFSLGDMEARLNAIRERLITLGEFDANRKLATPLDFTRIAVVSPEGAAGLGDFRTQADALHQHGLCKFSYFPATFQGNNNEQSILNALLAVLEEHKTNPFDALAIIRGGGDKAGLYELNKPKIARSICRLPLPVLVGVGHERDTTILDEVANRNFPTPSLVIAYILSTIIDNARDASKNYLQLQKQSSMLVDLARRECNSNNERLMRYAYENLNNSRDEVMRANRVIRTAPLDALRASRRKLENWQATLLRNADSLVSELTLQLEANRLILMQGARESVANAREQTRHLNQDIQLRAKETCVNERHRLATQQQIVLSNARSALQQALFSVREFAKTIELLDPASVLKRGFALVFSAENKVITSSSEVSPGDVLTVQLEDGHAQSTVKTVTGNDP